MTALITKISIAFLAGVLTTLALIRISSNKLKAIQNTLDQLDANNRLSQDIQVLKEVNKSNERKIKELEKSNVLKENEIKELRIANKLLIAEKEWLEKRHKEAVDKMDELSARWEKQFGELMKLKGKHGEL